MKHILIIFAFIVVSSIFTSCTDSTEQQIQEIEIQQEFKTTVGENEQDDVDTVD